MDQNQRELERMISKVIGKDLLKDGPFLEAGKINPLVIFRLSGEFPSMDLAKEEILLMVDDSSEAGNKGFVLTNKHLYFQHKGEESILEHGELSSLVLPDGVCFDTPKLKGVSGIRLAELFEKLGAQKNMVKPEKPKSLDDVINRANDLVKKMDKHVAAKRGTGKDEPAEDDPSWAVQQDFLDMLQAEGDAVSEVCTSLNGDKDFMKALQEAFAEGDQLSQSFKAEHVFMQDFIKAYNLLDADLTRELEGKEKFVLAYLFERLQGGDMAASISLGRLNDMVENPKFEESIQKLKSAEIIKLPEQYKDQFILPSLLTRIDHPDFERVSSQIYRFVSILAKADGTVSKEEEAVLKKILVKVERPKRVIANVKQSEVPENEVLEDVLADLNKLVGLENIKEDIKGLINFLKIQKVREEQGLAMTERSLHSVFMGPPGTGKTTIARLLGRVFKHLGYLDSGHVVETDRAGLVAGYIGQTALKVDEVVKAALGGVLFIDEAYALNRGEGGKDFGNEAIETLLKRMEDHRREMIVIVAGYPDEMETFINSNPGLKSRFNRYFKFDHYNGTELLNIFKLFAGNADFKLSEDAAEKLSFIFDELYEKRTPTFGNARVARNLFEECIQLQANRLVGVAPLTKEILMTLEEPDIPPVKETVRKILVFEPKE